MFKGSARRDNLHRSSEFRNFSVLVMSDSDQLQHDLAKLMSIISLRPSTIFLVPNTDKTYEAVKRAHPEWGLPSLENKLQSRLRFGFSLVWAIVPSGDTWSVVDLSSDDNVEHGNMDWTETSGISGRSSEKGPEYSLRIWVIPVLRYAVGVILLVVSGLVQYGEYSTASGSPAFTKVACFVMGTRVAFWRL